MTKLDRTYLMKLLRIHTSDHQRWLLEGIILGFILYLIFNFFELPKIIIGGLITIQIDLAIIVIPVVAALIGPLGGLVVGFFGSIVSDLLITHQIIALGGVNIALGIFGFIVGLPEYKLNNFSDGRKLAKYILFVFIGWICLIILYLGSLLMIANQSFEGTLLYNFLPFFFVSLISLLIISPVCVRIAEILILQIKKYWLEKS